jgi:hypothetical protein
LERVTTTKQGHYGYLVFVRHEGRRPWLGGTERGLVVHITGDTLYCLCKLLRNEPTARPMPLDILSGILTQASNQSPEEWGIIRVAITSLQHDTYIARVYFGVVSLPFALPVVTRHFVGLCFSVYLDCELTVKRDVLDAAQGTEEQERLHGSRTYVLLMPRTWRSSGKCPST